MGGGAYQRMVSRWSCKYVNVVGGLQWKMQLGENKD